MVLKELKYTVYGKVQGVCFRSEAVDTARSVGVAGWVQNNPDGTVGAGELLSEKMTRLTNCKSFLHGEKR